MTNRVFDSETYKKIGRPDLGSRMYYINGRTGKKEWGYVSEINYGHKRGVQFKIKKYKK